jgi:transposase-like protein
MEERGAPLDHTTVYRWVQRYAPGIEKRLRWAWRPPMGRWHADETYIKVRGRWVYLYRAVDEQGQTIDFCLSQTRTTKASEPVSQQGFERLSNMGETIRDPHRQSPHLRKGHRFPQTRRQTS